MGAFFSGGGGKRHAGTPDMATRKKKRTSFYFKPLLKLGFRKSLLQMKKSIVDDELYIENYSLVDAAKSMSQRWYDPSTHHPLSLGELLKGVGFTYRVAKKLENILSSMWEHYTPSTIADISIEYVSGQYDPIAAPEWCKNGGKWRFAGEINVPFVRQELHQSAIHVNMRASDFATAEIHPDFETRKAAKPGRDLYFHATSWDSAESICSQGVVHASGRRCLDFGIQQSFYTAPDLYDAKQWSEMKRRLFRGRCAILVFAVPKTFGPNFSSKTFDRPNREWYRLTAESRLCKKAHNELDHFDFVRGPVVGHVSTGAPHTPLKFQLASKTNASDE